MIDIHTHILPNVDDGSKSLDISKKLIEEDIKYGVDTIILTPHQNKLNLNKELIINEFNKFKNEVKDYNINIYLGSEIYYYDELLKDLDQNKIITMNKTNIIDSLYDIKLKGYKVIIAHIERYSYLSFHDIINIHKEGYLIQVNTKSFERKEHKKLIKFLLKNDLIDFISTDCHDLDKRNVSYEKCLKILKKYPDIYNKLINNKVFE